MTDVNVDIKNPKSVKGFLFQYYGKENVRVNRITGAVSIYAHNYLTGKLGWYCIGNIGCQPLKDEIDLLKKKQPKHSAI